MDRFSIGLFNDSFPPMIDGVAQTVKNYATHLQQEHCDVTVVTPSYHGVEDNYPFDVVRYPSFSAGEKVGYRVGVPFNPSTLVKLRAKKFDLMHVHAPFASSVLVNCINHHPHVPVVLTYHTRFDLDIEKRVPGSAMRKIAMSFLLDNVNSADEVWVVTGGCEKFLRDIGYEGTCRVMENGTDFARGQASPAAVAALREQYNVSDDTFVFLFVGRMMWYKNTRLILDALSILRQNGMNFRAFFVGDGYDAGDMATYAADHGLAQHVTFTGPVFDREVLRTYYSLADMFLFPSTYDTSGLVVKEAAACDCPSLLVRGSCAAEGIIHRQNGYLTEENEQVCAEVMMAACSDRNKLKQAGIAASNSIYLSWEEAVHRAYTRYQELLGK